MGEFQRTVVGGVSVSRMIVGTNWFLGYSHQSAAKDRFIKSYQTRENIAEILTVFFAGFMLIITLPDRAKVAGYFYLLIMPALLIAVSTFGQGVDFRQLTEERAAQVSGALESYYSQNGRYPQELRQLTPRHMLSLPEPVILFGQEWCYDGGGQDYALGYVTRDHWSDPRLYGRVNSSTGGEGNEPERICVEEIAALIARAPRYYELRRD